jgi:MFS family permease
MITTFFVSYVFDLFGRRYTLFFSYVLTAFIFLGTPYTSPNYYVLAIARCLIGVTMAAPTSHPLINDYVRKSSRGKAVALNGCGVVIGELFTMGILLNFTKEMTYFAFATPAAIVPIPVDETNFTPIFALGFICFKS